MGKFNSAKQFINQIFSGAQKTAGTGAINTTNISKNLKEFQKHKDDIIKTTDKYTKGLREEGKINVRKAVGPALGKVSKITQKKSKFNKGGRVGLKGGSFPDLNKDGETTFADVLIGRGVIPKNKKNKKKMIAKKSKTPMDKAVKKDKKNKRFV